MIGHLNGTVLFSDGHEVILSTSDGVGHQVFYAGVLPEGERCSLFISHIFKDPNQELYGFATLKQKKMFELLLTVKGVGPKSAYALMSALTVEEIVQAVSWDEKKTLTRAQGVGAKAAAQIVLDLSNKIQKVNIYSDSYTAAPVQKNEIFFPVEKTAQITGNRASLLQEALLACRELGFKDEVVTPVAQKLMGHHQILQAEQLVHLVLKEL